MVSRQPSLVFKNQPRVVMRPRLVLTVLGWYRVWDQPSSWNTINDLALLTEFGWSFYKLFLVLCFKNRARFFKLSRNIKTVISFKCSENQAWL